MGLTSASFFLCPRGQMQFIREPGACLMPGIAGKRNLLPARIPAPHIVSRGLSALRQGLRGGSESIRKETPVKRYGRNTARRQARSSSYAAMVRAWPRQRRIIPSTRSPAGGINGHTQPECCRPSSAVRVHRRLPGRESFGSKRFRTDPAISLQRQVYGTAPEAMQHQGLRGPRSCRLGGKQPETGASANGRGMSERIF